MCDSGDHGLVPSNWMRPPTKTAILTAILENSPVCLIPNSSDRRSSSLLGDCWCPRKCSHTVGDGGAALSAPPASGRDHQ